MDTKSFVVGLACGALLAFAASFLLNHSSETEVSIASDQETVSAIIPAAHSPVSTELKDSGTPELEIQDKLDAPDSGSSFSGLRWPENERAAFETEVKDDSWAYYIEQTMLQYLGSHSEASKFDVSRIECRTTKCQIEVVGYDESTVPVWQQVMYDIRQQPWSEFGQYGSSSGMIDGRLVIIGTLHRVHGDN